MDWIYQPSDPLLETLCGVVFMFIAVIIFTRLIGLRSFAKFSTFDFAFTVAIGSTVAATLTSDTSIVHGAITILGLLGLTAIVAQLQQKSDAFGSLISNQPLLLMDGPEMLEENLKAARVSKSQVFAKLREANVIRMNQIKAVVLETTGDISVLHVSEGSDCVLEGQLLDNVKRKP